MLNNIWQYAHLHWQDNVVASGISFAIGYFAGMRKHLNKIHQHLHHQDAKISKIHKHVKELKK